MKFIIAALLTALSAFAIGLFTVLPWYSFVVTALVVAVAVHQKPLKAFGAGFIALFLFWGIYACIIDAANEHILSIKVAHILPLGGNAYLLILLTAFVGGLLAGMGALTGSYLRMIKK